MSTTSTGHTMNKEMHPSPTLFPVVQLNSYCSAAISLCPSHINSIVDHPQNTRLSLCFCCADQSMYDTTASQTWACLGVEMTESQHSEDRSLGAQIKLYSRSKTCGISTPARLEDALLVSKILASPEDLASANFRFIQTSDSLNAVTEYCKSKFF